MTRSIEEIYNSLVAIKQQQKALDRLNSTSVTAIWRLLLYVIAVAMHTLEGLWDTYEAAVDAKISAKVPHRPLWYRDMTLRFMADKLLIPDTDEYDTTDITDGEIDKARVVKHAVATENRRTSVLTIKVAGEDNDGKRIPLPSDQAEQLDYYLYNIKDAGVKINLINQAPDVFNCTIDIYYDPMRLAQEVEAACEKAITTYIANLPFNGEYTNMALIDVLQAVPGVHIPELKSASASEAGVEGDAAINARYTPVAGYFTAGAIILNMIAYE